VDERDNGGYVVILEDCPIECASGVADEETWDYLG
jgi:hypothetical protein